MRISDWSSDVCSSDLAQVHDRRSRRPGSHRQLPPEPGAEPDGADESVAPGLQAALHPDPGIAGPARPPDRGPAVGLRDRRAQGARPGPDAAGTRSEEHTSELQSLMSISYAAFCMQNT